MKIDYPAHFQLDRLKSKIANDGKIEAKVVTGSMEPILPTGQWIKATKILRHEDIRNYDIILFWDGDKYVVHYVIGRSQLGREEPIFLTKGLKGSIVDQMPVTYSHIVGKVEAKIPKRIIFWQKVKLFLLLLRE